MRKKERYAKVLEWFRTNVPVAETELHYENEFQLLVAVILSAQCTDQRINQVTPKLFEDYPTPESMAVSTPEVIFEYIKSVSYPNSKAKHLVAMAQMVTSDYGGKIPADMDQLMRLPGVGRKTANVIQSVAFKKATMAVDTHVFRVSHRLGLVDSKCTTPYSVEIELIKNIPAKDIPMAHHWILLHGRYICQSRTPKCADCGLRNYCAYYENNQLVIKK